MPDRLTANLLLNTDSYKASHYLQYPPGADGMFGYIESRGGAYAETVWFGLQAILHEYLATPVTHAMIDEAAALFAAHGEPFAERAFRRIVDVHGGWLPLEIRAAPEGLVIPTHNVLATIESTDPELFWLGSYLESLWLRVWYPATVATRSRAIKATIRAALIRSADDVDGQLPFKLHDFGARGASSSETAALGGMAHLVNFRGTDTVLALVAARRYYDEPMAGFSIPAAEHSTITAWGRDSELAAYRNMLARFGNPGAIFACVSDSYDIYHAVDAMWGEALRDAVIQSGATLVIRPDSGDPATVVLRCAELLAARFGTTTNRKGYKVLNHVRLIQGDGVNEASIRHVLDTLLTAGYSADNLAFGMGGALLQDMNRDTLRWALKTSAIRVDGEWRDVYKAPVTDPGKTSKPGRLMLFRDAHGHYVTGGVDAALGEPLLRTVYRNGELLANDRFAAVRERAAL
ncbi:nicotinate phosphoribosyltransferase [Jeongeupia chitinilytica]|uniref:Nicotinamide phosphoribosyltransferase n=1 Tax=Jeongeupia chitinilytica TaxID=1041641 RepID=A0ABQ3H0D1_9NEIS|nr:nicotinate phosphoribosyltransferase [Jeongeupia chitinilytica]GHD62521.1 nicotinate phosphoribosyltransferase [Jeongeupia chitinilytica]